MVSKLETELLSTLSRLWRDPQFSNLFYKNKIGTYPHFLLLSFLYFVTKEALLGVLKIKNNISYEL